MYAKIDCNTNGQNTIVAAVAGKKIRVLQREEIYTGSVTSKWRSGTTDLQGPRAFAANGGVFAPETKEGYFETAVGEDLVLNLNAAIQVGGSIIYQLIP